MTRINRASLTLVTFSILPLVVGCSVAGEGQQVTEDSTGATATSTTVRQTDDAGNRLPFDTAFPNRWSINNNGTPYEPCTAIPEETVLSFKLDPKSVRDVAVADHQTVRGCRWVFSDNPANSLGQAVGNGEPSLAQYRHRQREVYEFLPSIEIAGREVLRYRTPNTSECSASIKSRDAQVFTTVLMFRDTPPVDQLCEIPVNFLRATIDRIPR